MKDDTAWELMMEEMNNNAINKDEEAPKLPDTNTALSPTLSGNITPSFYKMSDLKRPFLQISKCWIPVKVKLIGNWIKGS